MFSCNICEIKKKKRCQVVFHTKREHNMKLRLNYKGWCQRYVTCLCKDCNFLGSSKSYDDYLVEYHDLPKSSRKNKSRKVSNKETIYQCGKCDAEYTTRVSLKQHIAIKHLESVQLRYL